ncbi:L,D-transpeptidase family protein [Arcobacter sp. YIC-310]|uniref:L,D-transpeptidase family protein n=1 Tax=Arcobacter sp. YIC-310 TaxID=3376632 RepID=UPI003C2711D7
MFKKIILHICILFITPSFSNEFINQNETFVQVQPTFHEKSKEALHKLLKSKKTRSVFLSRYSLKKYYKEFNYELLWLKEDGLNNFANVLLEAIKNDPVLKPHSQKVFKLSYFEKKYKALNKEDKNYLINIAKIDFILTGMYSKYMKYLSSGYINWKEFKETLKELEEKDDIDAGWEKYNIRKNRIKLLKKAKEEQNLNVAFNAVNYTFPQAKQLENKIKEFEKLALAGGYIKLPKFKVLKEGSKSDIVEILRQRLLQSNDLIKNDCTITIKADNLVTNSIQKNNDFTTTNDYNTTSDISNIEERECYKVFDENVKKAVISFQENHGLTPDGVVGAQTRRALNMSIEKKIVKMRLNLERMRWMPRTLGENFLLVNIPEYKLRMYKKNKVELDMPIVVGKRQNPTPIFSHKMSFVVLNPYWRIPQSIVEKELIPKVIKNPSYLKEKGINIHETWDHKSATFDVSEVDLQAILPKKEDEKLKNDEEALNAIEKETNEEIVENTEIKPIYRFIQIPSETNPLGRMKFMFPNKYSVYLHDSPAKKYFKYTKRAYSHGCIRLAEPKKLLEAISKEDSSLDFDEAKEVLTQIEKKSIDLKKQIPVHMVYLTSWVDENGKLQFRNDVYRYDRIQKKLLYKR